MLYYDFYDYKDFQERFGIVHHGNGAKNRKNKRGGERWDVDFM